MPLPPRTSERIALAVFWVIVIVFPVSVFAAAALVWNPKLLFAFPLVALAVHAVAERLFRTYDRLWRRIFRFSTGGA
jgi:4-amino-4-deoxy-L-arabinose transferase-like glycosyltransferase